METSQVELTSYYDSSMVPVELSPESHCNERSKPLTQSAFDSLMGGYKVWWFVMKGKDWSEGGWMVRIETKKRVDTSLGISYKQK